MSEQNKENKDEINNEDNSIDLELSEKPEQTKEEAEQNEVLLKLGDIIIITDPKNEILDNNVFLIEYIDPHKIKLINSDTFDKIVLTISPEGVIGDGSITSIKIISSNPKEGYARQNDLLPGTWINIYFSGEIPVVITGEITNLEEDMIEIKTTDKEDNVIYINFNYQGIPEDIPIETFEIRPRPSASIVEDLGEKVEPGEKGEEIEELEESDEENVEIPLKTIKKQVKDFIDLGDIEFGEIVKVEEYAKIDKEKYRYNISIQTNDLFEELISKVPSHKRTNSVLNNIHIMITRFLQLREISSTFDSNKNVTGVVKHTSDDKPLAEYLSEFKNKLYWILLVAKNIKKITQTAVISQNYSDVHNTAAPGNMNPTLVNPGLDELNEILDISIYFKKYKNDKNIEGQNKYVNLYRSIDPYMTPFKSPNIIDNDVFAKKNGIIIENEVTSDINAIIDNLGDFYSTVIDNSTARDRRFVVQRYNLGLDRLQATNLKGSRMIAHRVKLTNNDSLAINSILTLPEPTVRFSQINLPGSNLLVKANLNLHFLNYWQLLKQKTRVSQMVINGFDNEIEYDENNFVDNIKQYYCDLTAYERSPELSNLDIYKVFLKTIIPKIRVLFNLVKKYIKGKLSMVDVISYLEPFLVYPIDLTFKQYQTINHFIYEKIAEYNKLFKNSEKAFSTLKYNKYVRSNDGNSVYYFSNPLYSVFSTNFEMQKTANAVFESYGFHDQKFTISPSEFLKKIIEMDYGNLYNSAVALSNINLTFPESLSSIFETDKDMMKQIIENGQKNDKCSSFIIAKKYYSLEELKADDDVTIYYDKEYDNTNYDIIEQKYKKQKNTLTKDEMILFLTDEFMNKNKMDNASSEQMATTLVEQVKKVREGDYAILIKTKKLGDVDFADEMEYYVRNDDKWIEDKDVDPSVFIEDDDILCNLNYNCIYNSKIKDEDKCEAVDVSKDTIIQNALKQIIDQFDKKYDISKQELSSKINSEVEYFTKTFDKLQSLKRKEFLKYNNEKHKLGISIENEVKNQIVSPYAKLKELILGQTDFVKKQIDIIKFKNAFCRPGDPNIPNLNDGEMEDEWWLYCIKTNTKLMPLFYYELANAYINNNRNYERTLDFLKKTIGKQSDDGDSWVDVHSGEVICKIDMDVSEGYKDGFVDKSRDIIEKDIAEVIMEGKIEKKSKRLSPEGEMISNVVSTLSTNMGIEIEQSRNFIINVVSDLMKDTKVMKTQSEYRNLEEAYIKKTGKKLPSYESAYSLTMIHLILGAYLIGVQTSIPSIRTKKTFPGCFKSFEGFPFEGEGNSSGLEYVACVASKSRDKNIRPWNGLHKEQGKIVETIRSLITKFLYQHQDVIQRVKDKVDYLQLNPEQFVPEEYALTKWINFLPPLKKFHIKNLQNVSDSFKDDLLNELRNGNRRQTEKLLVIESKIIDFSLAIQECIQKLVEKKELLLKGSGKLFMDNACCNEDGGKTKTTLQYFADEDSNIDAYVNVTNNLSSIMSEMKNLTEANTLLSLFNTKRRFPEISNDFSEETIYYAFISLCKFQSSIPLTEEIMTVCIDKPDYLNKMDTIQEKISKLKRDNRNYTKDQFLRLFALVSRNNIIHMKSSKHLSNIDKVEVLINKFNDLKDSNVPKTLLTNLSKILEHKDETLKDDLKEMKDLKNYLYDTNDKMRKNIIGFFNGRLSKLEQSKVNKFLVELTDWRFDKEKRNEDAKIYDSGLDNYINFIKTYIEMFARVFPKMIINKARKTINVPSYWKLSVNHVNDVNNMVINYYSILNKFFNNAMITNVLKEMVEESNNIYELSKITPTFSNINIGDKSHYNVFDKRTVTLLYEYYFLSVLTGYINLTNNAKMVKKIVLASKQTNKEDEIYTSEFIIERELSMTDMDQEFIQGDKMKLSSDVSDLLLAYLTIVSDAKKTINVSYSDIQDKVFKLKEAEKYTFTDKLRDMTDEERTVDNILKQNKLGPLYSLGLSKGITRYDADHFEHDKKVAEEVGKTMNILEKKNKGIRDPEMDVEDAIAEEENAKYIDLDARQMNMSDDFDDGDPWGDEGDDDDSYY